MSGHTLVNQLALGVSTGGNTAGNTGTTQVPIAFAGVSGITLSQVSGASQATISIIGPGAAAASAIGVSTGGNTAGNTATTQGTIVFAAIGGNTASQVTAPGAQATISIAGPAAATAISAVGPATVVGVVNRYALEDHVHAGIGPAGVSTAGNTAGSTGLVQGSLLIVGSGNITASQSTNASGVTVTLLDVGSAEIFVAGVSTGGNTAGNTGTTVGTMAFAAAGGITASQATAAGSLATISFSGPAVATFVSPVGAASSVGTVNRYALEDHVHAGVALAGVSTVGNTAGTTGLAAGSLLIVGSQNITVSQSSNASGATVTFLGAAALAPSIATSVKAVAAASSVGTVTRYAPEDHQHAGIRIAGISTEGNTAGTTGFAAGSLAFFGSQNITLSASTDAAGVRVTFLGATTAAAAPIATSVSPVAAASSVGTVTRYAPEDHRHVGIVSAGVSTAGNTAGTTGLAAGSLLIIASGNIISASQSSDSAGATVSLVANTFAGADVVTALGVSTGGNTAGNTGLQFGSIVLQATGGATLSQATAAGNHATIQISVAAAAAAPNMSIWQSPRKQFDNGNLNAQPLKSATISVQPIFIPQPMSATAIEIINGAGFLATAAMSYSIGLYTMSGSTASLASSGTVSLSTGAATSRFSGALGTWNLSQSNYLLAILASENTAGAGNNFIYGEVMSGLGGGGGSRWGDGLYSASKTALPASIHVTDINRTMSTDWFNPWLALAGTF